MVREIKFRAFVYHPTFKLVNGEYIGKDMIAEVQTIYLSKPGIRCKFKNKDSMDFKIFKLMQYTGLKDENEKEIYEGDIVKGHVISLIKFGEYSNNESYEYYDGGYGYYLQRIKKTGKLSDNYDVCSFTEDYVCELIGNMYENPELLEK